MLIILNHVISLLAIEPGDSTPLDMTLTNFHVNNILRISIPVSRLNPYPSKVENRVSCYQC
jgi:hypothetical protein